MPRAPTVRTSQRQRPAPYGTRSASHNMAAQLMSPYQAQYSPWEPTQQSPYDQQQLQLPMNMYALEPSLHTPYELPAQNTHQRHSKHRSQSAPWTAQEDDRLLKSKREGLQWDVIQKKYFPDKSTGNACRKRYERLENKRRATDWDDARLQNLAVAYMEMRQEIWASLAKRLGEKWDHVEKKVIEEGYKNLANKASYHTRNPSSGSSRSHHSGYDHENSSPHDDFEQDKQGEDDDEDSGIGLGLGSGNNNRRQSNTLRMSNQGSCNTLDPGHLHNILQQPGLYHQ